MRKSILFLVLALIGFEVLFSKLATSESKRKGSFYYFSNDFSDGSGYATRVNLFNPWDEPVWVNLEAYDSQGAPMPVFNQAMVTGGFTTTHFFSGTMLANGSLHVDTTGVGNGPFAGSLKMSSPLSVAGWVTERGFFNGNTNAQTTSRLRLFEEAYGDTKLVGVQPFLEADANIRGSQSTAAYLTIRDVRTSLFSATGVFTPSRARVEAYLPDSAQLVSVNELNIPSNGFISGPVLNLLPGLSPFVPYTIHVNSVDGKMLSSVTYQSDNVLAKQTGAVHSSFFSSVMGEQPNLSSYHYQNLPTHNVTGEIRMRNTDSFSPLSTILSLEGSSQQGGFVDFNADLALGGELLVDTDQTLGSNTDQVGIAQVRLDTGFTPGTVTLSNGDAMTINESAQFMGYRMVLPVDGARDWDGDLAQSMFSLYNHGADNFLVMLAFLDGNGDQISVLQLDIQPGHFTLPVWDLLADQQNTRALLIESGLSNTPVTADILVHGRDGAQEILDRLPGIPVYGERTVGTYPYMLIQWNNEFASTCLGSGVTILDIVRFIEQDFSCD